MSTRKIILALVVFVTSTFTLPSIVFAHETTPEHNEEHQVESLLAQISELLDIVAKLQAQLSAMQGGTSAPQSSYSKLTRSLSVGSRGADVKVLQQILNDNINTRIVALGDGSKGNETDYFGNLTKEAVIKFQNLYKAEILIPVGLSFGTGFVGPSTIKAINRIIDVKNKQILENKSDDVVDGKDVEKADKPEVNNDTAYVPEIINKETVVGKETIDPGSGFVFVERESPYIPPEEMTPENVLSIIERNNQGPAEVQNYDIGSFSSYEGVPGTTVQIDGRNLKNTAQIKFDSKTTVTGVPNFDGSILTFRVPNISVGYYVVEVSQDGEVSPRAIDFVITKNNPETPELYLVSPTIGKVGTEITIYGRNFTRFGNVVEFGLGMGTFSGIESLDGRSLKIKIDPNIGFVPPSPNGLTEWPVYITIINANGTSVGEGLFALRL